MKNSRKARYSLDVNNTLLIARGNERLSVPGELSIDRKNRLIYHINKPSAWKRTHSLPGKIVFEGQWSLDHNHDLVCVLDETESQSRGGRLVIKGEIIKADQDILAFSCTCVNMQGALGVRLLKLSGALRMDTANRIEFAVSRNLASGVLHFRGDWYLNANQQIVYTYERQALKTRTKISKTLELKGYWKILGAQKLAYVLSGARHSPLEFKAYLQSPTLYPENKAIKYRIGAGVASKGKARFRVVTLYGEWKFNRKAGVEFQMAYRGHELHQFVFGSQVTLNDKNEISLLLTDEVKKPLGAQLVLTHTFLKEADASWFLRLKRSAEEKTAEIGLRIPF